ncbi:MAG: tetratricopeptide repeat protein [Candidatus Eremiobacteraeota bacterium]|nr:tetratricopeptide repeat protein [Candidatus Eremiobacteraeota bacterium]
MVRETQPQAAQDSGRKNNQPGGRMALLALAVLVLLDIAAFSPVLQSGFTNWDDDRYVTRNPMIRELSVQSVNRIFTTTKYHMYTPLVQLSFAVEYRLFGLNPVPYHAVNLVLHILNSLLVFSLVLLITGDFTAAFVAALLFSLSPLRVQSVAWISERKGLLSALFFFSAFISYVYYVKEHRVLYYLLSLFLFIMSLLAKPLGALLPFALALYDYCICGRFGMRQFLLKLPYLSGFVFAGVIAWLHLWNSAGLSGHYPYPFSVFQSFFIACYLCLFYLRIIMVPFHLHEIYPLSPEVFQALPLAAWLSPLILLVIVLGILPYLRRLKRHSPLHYHHVLFGVVFFLVNIFPHLRILPLNATSLLALRHAYIPSLGIFLIAGVGLSSLYHLQKTGMRRALFTSSLVIVIVVFAISSHVRCGIYKDGLTLWNHVLGHYPRYTAALNNKGIICHQAGDFKQALESFEKALAINPFDVKIRINLANLCRDMHDKEGEKAHLDFALYFMPDDPPAFYHMGNIFREEGHYDRAVEMYSRAVEREPGYMKPYVNMGNVFYEQGDWPSAMRAYDKAILLCGSLSAIISRHENIALQNLEAPHELYDYCSFMKKNALENQRAGAKKGAHPVIYQN